MQAPDRDRTRMETMMSHDERVAWLVEQIAELETRLPKHSVPANMIVELEELEEELKALKTQGIAERG